MPDHDRYPTTAEFWQRLDKRGVEEDLRQELRRRAGAESGSVTRVGTEATVVAVVSRLLPGSAVPHAVIAAFVDANYDKPMGRADERVGVMPRSELLPAGFAVLDDFSGGNFASLTPEAQDALMERAENGELTGPPGFDAAIWFKRLRDLVLLGYGADPRGMVQMGYPGPAYKPGHLWLSNSKVAARVRRTPGYLEL
jgi:hypothetical protein